MRKTKKKYYILEELSRYPELVHGFSTRNFGDMRAANVDNFFKKLNLRKEDLVLMEQVHGDKIKIVGKEDKGEVTSGADGMITDQPGIILGVKTADCLPVLLYDPRAKIIGIAHAGWRGVAKKIGQKLVALMIKLGSLPGDILVGVGPHIGGCCYTIKKVRTARFKTNFGRLPGMVYQDKYGLHLDLAVPLRGQLRQSGLKDKNIFIPPLCTSCQNKKFFSYRKDTKETFGEMLGIISLVPEV